MLSTRQENADDDRSQNVTNLVKNDDIVELHDHIWNHHDKYIEISTNIPVIGSLIHEIAVKISEIGPMRVAANTIVFS